MALYKRGKTWWVSIHHGGGHYYRRSLRTTNYLEAKNKEVDLRRDFDRAKGGALFSEVAAQYLEWAKTSKPASYLRERQRLEKISASLSGQGVMALKDITPLVIERLKAGLIERGLSKATVNRYLQILRGMIYRAIDWDLFPGPNPFRKVKFFRENPVIHPLSSDEADRIRQAAEAVSMTGISPLQRAFGDIIILALNTGMRKSELLHLAWADIKDGETMVKGKGGKVRRVPLNRMALEIIGRQPKGGEFVFDIPNRDQHDLMRRTVVRVAQLSGIPWHFHLLRHHFASALMERGADIVTIGEILGHSRTTTSLIYSHTTRERKSEAVERLLKHP